MKGFAAGRRVRVVAAVAGLVAVQAGIASWELRGLEHVGNYDTAYYYTVARNVATGRGPTETVLWHYMGPARPVGGPAGDYWMVGWPLLLGALLRVVGHSGVDAMRACAGLSVLLPVLAFRLAWRLRPRVGTSTLAGLLVCAQSRLFQTNVTPDVTLCYQLLVLLGLGAGVGALRRGGTPARLCGAGALLALPAWVRGEGFVGLLAVGLAVVLWGRGTPRRRSARAGWVFLGAACGMAPLYLYQLAAFGRLNPLPRVLTFWMTRGGELYRFETDPSFSLWRSQGLGAFLADRYRCLGALAYQTLIQVQWPLLGAAGLGVLSGRGRRRGGVLCLATFLALSALVPAALVPFVTNPDRFVMHAIPVLCVLAASAVGDLAARARRAGGRAGGAVALAAASAVVVAGCVLVRAPLNSQGHFEHGWKAQFRPVPPHLAAARALNLRRDDVVLTQDPWQVAAVLDVRTVMIPYDGPAALRGVVDRYRPRFALLPGGTSKGANPRLAGSLDGYAGILRGRGFRAVLTAGDQTWYEAPGEE